MRTPVRRETIGESRFWKLLEEAALGPQLLQLRGCLEVVLRQDQPFL